MNFHFKEYTTTRRGLGYLRELKTRSRFTGTTNFARVLKALVGRQLGTAEISLVLAGTRGRPMDAARNTINQLLLAGYIQSIKVEPRVDLYPSAPAVKP